MTSGYYCPAAPQSLNIQTPYMQTQFSPEVFILPVSKARHCHWVTVPANKGGVMEPLWGAANYHSHCYSWELERRNELGVSITHVERQQETWELAWYLLRIFLAFSFLSSFPQLRALSGGEERSCAENWTSGSWALLWIAPDLKCGLTSLDVKASIPASKQRGEEGYSWISHWGGIPFKLSSCTEILEPLD